MVDGARTMLAAACRINDLVGGQIPLSETGAEMQRELELKFELSKSDVERLTGELPEDELGIGPPTQKNPKDLFRHS
jgi:hypothetical protein